LINILVVHNDSCPSLNPSLERINQIIEELNVKANIETKLIHSNNDAEDWKFTGSPTIIINNEDIEPIDTDIYRLNNCRTYLKDGGGISPIPSKQTLKRAICKFLNNKEEDA
jgi:hypothetical protein